MPVFALRKYKQVNNQMPGMLYSRITKQQKVSSYQQSAVAAA